MTTPAAAQPGNQPRTARGLSVAPGLSGRTFSKSSANLRQTCGGPYRTASLTPTCHRCRHGAHRSLPAQNPKGPPMSLTFIRSAAGLALLTVLTAGCGTAAAQHAATGDHQHRAPMHAAVTTPPASPATTPPASPAATAPVSPATKPAAPASPSNPIPQGNGGDQDPDNNGGPSDGDGNI
jgi:hypothetical protein